MQEKVEGGLLATTNPRFFGWVIGGSHPTGVAADFLVSAWGQNSANHKPVPAAAAAEETAARWLLDLLQLPANCSVGVATGATMASTICLAAARGEVLRNVGWDVEAEGLFGAPPISVLIGADAHETLLVGLRLIGLGGKRLIRIETDNNGGIKSDEFFRAIEKVEGPVISIAQAGQLNTGAFDPFPEIATATHDKGGWMHVDGAFGLWARAAKDYAHLAAGVEEADSWSVDGHKWLQTPFDCGFAITRRPEAHARAMAMSASYLPPVAPGERNPADFVPELSRRARGFFVWATIKALGRKGVAELVARNCQTAAKMAERLSAEDGLCLMNDVVLNQFLIRFGEEAAGPDGDIATEEMMERIVADGTCYMAGAKWRGRTVMRVSVTNYATTFEDGEKSADAIIRLWRDYNS